MSIRYSKSRIELSKYFSICVQILYCFVSEQLNMVIEIRDLIMHKYIIRSKDNSGGIAFGLDLPVGDEFDMPVSLYLTRKQTNEMKETVKNRDDYRFLRNDKTFDYLPVKNRKSIPVPLYVLSFRIVRFKITDDTYETVVTNIDAGSFPAAELKKLYHMRWGIEISFRDLKYSIGLLHFHAKKTESVLQEIFASLIMHNFTELITSHVISQKKNRKYTCKANFTLPYTFAASSFWGMFLRLIWKP